MRWEASNGLLFWNNGIPVMKSTEISTLNIHFDNGLDFLNFLNNFVIPVAKRYGIEIEIKKTPVKEKILTEAGNTLS